MSAVDILGLPLHPLVVHAAVILVPLAAAGALLLVFVRPARDRYGWLTAGFAIAAGLAAIGARVSGEAFLASMGGGSPAAQAHQAWGTWVPVPAVALAVALPALIWLDRRPDASRPLWLALAVVVVAAALAGLVLVLLAGHSGATAVWG